MRTVEQLSAQANSYEFSPQVSFRSWIHVLKTMLIQAKGFQAHNDLEDAYILYLRWADLALNQIPKHPQFKENKHKYDELAGQLGQVLKDAENVKLMLKKVEKERPSEPAESQTHAARANQTRADSKPQSPAIPDKEELSTHLYDLDLSTLRSLRRNSQHEAPNISVTAHLSSQIAYQNPKVRSDSGILSSSTSSTSAQSCHKVTASTEGGGSLRTLFVPSSLEEAFLSYAAENTSRNLETCGILCGKLNRNAYFVSDLLIPKQESTANSCSTTHEEELFDFIESRDLFILGWIHTHPSQSCFMSSVDLHTHNSYQIMLPEAIAIVCSPKHNPNFGAFRLTSPPGMDIITRCKKTGFHPHDEKNIYRSVIPGHMKLLDYKFTVKDLR